MCCALSPFLMLQMQSFWEWEGTEEKMTTERKCICSVCLLGNKYVTLISLYAILQQESHVFQWLLFCCVKLLLRKQKDQPCHCPSLTGEFIQMAGLDMDDHHCCPVMALRRNITTTFRGLCAVPVNATGWLCSWERWRNYQCVPFCSHFIHVCFLLSLLYNLESCHRVSKSCHIHSMFHIKII